MAKSLIELHNVSRIYKVGDEPIHALDRVSLKIKQGEYVAVTGPSGSGKSTLAHIIGGLDTPTSGTVVVGRHNLSGVHDEQLSAYRNQTVGFIFQSFDLQPSSTILENVMLPLIFSGMKASERKQRALQYLQTVGLESRIDHKPNELSGGQQQLAAIARALVTQPQILIADEPTGNLDSVRSQEIFNLLAKIHQDGTTVLVITHNPNMTLSAQRILQMSDGHLTELKV